MTSPEALALRQKRKLRREHREARAQLGEAARQGASNRIAHHVIYSSYLQRNRRIACYLPMADEVDTWPIIARAWRMKKKIYVPITRRDRTLTFREIRPESDLTTTGFGLLQPVSGEERSARELDLVLVPMVAFDGDCQRIGMGGGYYDRTFSFLRARRSLFRPKLIGLAFASQRVDKIPLNPWDIRLYRVITELG